LEALRLALGALAIAPPVLGDVGQALGDLLRQAEGEVFGISDALAWAGGFTFPAHVWTQDSAELEGHGGDLAAMVRARQEHSRADRLSRRRIHECVDQLDPDFDRILDLADGIRIFVADDFEPNGAGERPPLRAKYVEVSAAVNKLMFDLYEAGVIILLPTAVALGVLGAHFSSTHWAPKRGKARGRPIGDCSNNRSGSNLNSLAVEDKVRGHWGPVEHPTLRQLVNMILGAADEWGWDEIVLWKTDLAGAFHLADIRPEDVRLMAYELTGDLTLFYTRGMFGWQGSPFMFGVITRVLERVVNRRIDGRMLMYVDDMMGVSRRSVVESDITEAGACARELLGPASVAEDKTESGRLLDFIGWRIDLDARKVSIAPHSVKKTFHSFMSVDLAAGRIGFRHAEKLASYASRYAEVMRPLRPFGACFFEQKMRSARKNSEALLLAPVVWAIRLWQLHLAVMHLRGAVYCIGLESFRPRRPVLFVEFDASLSGVGVVLSEVSDEGLRTLRVVALRFPFELGEDSSYQNTAEFLCLVVAFVLVARMGRGSSAIGIRGDSASALSWASRERFRAGRALRATIVYVALGSRYDMAVNEAEHIAGEENGVCDRLSRGTAPRELGFGPNVELAEGDRLAVLAALELCNPAEPLETLANLGVFYGVVDNFVEGLGAVGAAAEFIAV
jgi:hypothetical protein